MHTNDMNQQENSNSVHFNAGSNQFNVVERVNFMGTIGECNAGEIDHSPLILHPLKLTVIHENKGLLGQRNITAQNEDAPKVSFNLYSKIDNHMGELSVLFERNGKTITAKKPDHAVLRIKGSAEPHVFLVYTKNKPDEAPVAKPIAGVPTSVRSPALKLNQKPMRPPLDTVVRVPYSHVKAVFDVK